jgi:hypothetical protein
MSEVGRLHARRLTLAFVGPRGFGKTSLASSLWCQSGGVDLRTRERIRKSMVLLLSLSMLIPAQNIRFAQTLGGIRQMLVG